MKKILFSSLPTLTQEVALGATSREEVTELAKALAQSLQQSGKYSMLITRSEKKVSVQEITSGKYTVIYDGSTSKDTVVFCGRLLPLPSGEEQSIDSGLKDILGSFVPASKE